MSQKKIDSSLWLSLAGFALAQAFVAGKRKKHAAILQKVYNEKPQVTYTRRNIFTRKFVFKDDVDQATRKKLFDELINFITNTMVPKLTENTDECSVANIWQDGDTVGVDVETRAMMHSVTCGKIPMPKKPRDPGLVETTDTVDCDPTIM